MSVVTKNFQITIPEQRLPTGSGSSGEFTYLRLGLEQNISENDAGTYICRDRILPQNYISIRVIVASRSNGGFSVYPFSGWQAYPRPPSSASYPQSISQTFGAGPNYPFKFGTPTGTSPQDGNSLAAQSNLPGDEIDFSLRPFGFLPPPPPPPPTMFPFDGNNNGLRETDDQTLVYPILTISSTDKPTSYAQRQSLQSSLDMSDVFTPSSSPSQICSFNFSLLSLLIWGILSYCFGSFNMK